MRFKVGDRVRIKSLDWYEKNKDILCGDILCGEYYFVEGMKKFCSEIFTISDIVVDGYLMLEDIDDYIWTDGMIEGLVEEEKVSNVNSITQDRVDKLACKIDEELPSGNPYEWECPEGYQFVDENGNVINAQKIVLEKKRKEYPKTYEDCIMLALQGAGYNRACLLVKFEKLLTCRDAYWKIAGEEMGLGRPWEPDWGDDGIKYTIEYYNEEIIKDLSLLENRILVFPTVEMRDAFYENFKEEIESVKELL